MKYLLIFSLMFSFAQAQVPAGLGPFHINSTTTAIRDSLINASVYVSDLPITADIADENYRENPKVNNQKIFLVDGLIIANMKFEEIKLKFWKDTLYDVEVLHLPEDFYESFKTKFGEPKIRTEIKKVTCRSKLVGDYQEEEKTYFCTFRSAEK